MNNMRSIYEYPVQSTGWKRMKRDIERSLSTKPDHKSFVLCVDSILKNNKTLKDLYNKGFVYMGDNNIFSENTSFVVNEGITLVERYKAEFNPYYVQLESVCAIKDQYDNYLMLEVIGKGETRLTMVKGHVDFIQNMYHMSEIEYIDSCMSREIKEEISNVPKSKIPIRAGILYYGESPRVLEHLGIVYTLELSRKEIKNIISNEPRKHRTRLVRKSDILSGKVNVDDWTRYLITNQIV